jgi:RIO kinase 2
MQTKDKLLHPAGPDDKNIETEEGSYFSLTDEGVSDKSKLCESERESEV